MWWSMLVAVAGAAEPWPEADAWVPVELGGVAVTDASGDTVGLADASADIVGPAAVSWAATDDVVFLRLAVAADAADGAALVGQDRGWLVDLDGVADDWELLVLVSGTTGDLEVWTNDDGTDGVFVVGLSLAGRYGELATGETRATADGTTFTVDAQLRRSDLAALGWISTTPARFAGVTALTFVLEWEDVAGCNGTLFACDQLPSVLSDTVHVDLDGDGATEPEEQLAGTDISDADTDDDGRLDGDELADADGDGISDALECDTDDDGLPDGLEVGVTVASDDTDLGEGCFVADLDPGVTSDPALADTDGGGLPDGDEDPNGDGAIDTFETDPTDPDDDLDNDADGIPDAVDDLVGVGQDSDSDGDGIDDAVEEGIDTDGDGVPDFGDLDSDGDGLLDADEGTDDLDGDGVGNWRDLDSDGDGVGDAVESDLDGDGVLDDTDGDGDPDHLDTDSDDDGLYDEDEADTNGDGYLDDTDGDGVIDMRDLDSDDDGVPDEVEGDASGNGRPDDADGDGLPDFLDLDSDNDGVPDAVEADPDGNGRLEDSDGDGVPDLQDTDSDNDGILDGDELDADTDCDGAPDRVDADPEDGFCDTGQPIPPVDTSADTGGVVPPQPPTNPFSTPGSFTGGSCSTAPRSGVLLGLPALLLGLLRRRRAAWVAPVLAASGVASAQGLDAQRFEPSVDGGLLSRVEEATTPAAGTAYLGVWLHHAEDPFVFRPDDGSDEVPLLDAVSTTSVVGAWSLGALRVGAELPIHLFTAGYGIDDPVHAGDLRLSTKARLLSAGLVAAGMYGDLTLPTGQELAWVGSGIARVHGGALLTASSERWVASMSAGVRSGTGAEVGDLVVGPSVRVGLGGALRMTDAVSLAVELDGESWVGNADLPGARPAEWLLSARNQVPGVGALVVGAGSGLSPGIGSPELRLVAALQWVGEPEAEPEPPVVPEPATLDAATAPAPSAALEPLDVEVLDPWGRPVPGATVRVAGRTGALAVDETSRLAVRLEPDRYEVVVEAPDLASARRSVDLTAGGRVLPVVLYPTEVVLDRDAERLVPAGPVPVPAGAGQLDAAAVAQLDVVAAFLVDTPELRVRVEVHADGAVSAERAAAWSLERAERILEHLVEAGVEAERLEAVGRGREAPLRAADDAAFHEINRRVEFVLRPAG